MINKKIGIVMVMVTIVTVVIGTEISFAQSDRGVLFKEKFAWKKIEYRPGKVTTVSNYLQVSVPNLPIKTKLWKVRITENNGKRIVELVEDVTSWMKTKPKSLKTTAEPLLVRIGLFVPKSQHGDLNLCILFITPVTLPNGEVINAVMTMLLFGKEVKQ